MKLKDIEFTYSFGLFDEIDQFASRISSPNGLQFNDIQQVLVEYLIRELYVA